jgi:hypothetical protein
MTNSAILDDGFCLAVDQVQHKDRRSRQMLPVGRSDVPALLPAALVSIQKGQPANSATRRQTSDRSSAGRVWLRAGAAPSA